MKTIQVEAKKFLEQNNSSFETIFTDFHTYLYLFDKKLALWAVIKTLLNQGKSGIPIDILESQEENYYSLELNNYFIHGPSDFQVASLQLSEKENKKLQEKSDEYQLLKKSFNIYLQIFSLAETKSWKEALVMASLLEENFNSIKVIKYDFDVLFIYLVDNQLQSTYF